MNLKTYKNWLKENVFEGAHAKKSPELLKEAYSFFPKDEKTIKSTLKDADWPKEKIADVVSLFNYLKKKDETPINCDLATSGNVNVTRTLQGSQSIDNIISNSGISNFKIKWGNGSSGNRGANNRGNAFEKEFADSLFAWFEDGDDAVKDASILAAIQDLDKEYDLSSSKEIWIDVVGGENTKRPLKYGNKIVLTNTKGSGYDIGTSVTDITVTTDKGKNIYLSLKLGGTTTFFNVGIRKKLTQDEIDKGTIKDKDGKALLKMFGINNKRFCTIFNDKVKTKGGKVTTKPDENLIQGLLQSGIGYGYHVIHQLKGKVISKKMDSKAMKAAAKVGACTVYYGGKTGKGKRIDMEFKSSYYTFKLNIRDTQGKDGYPTRMMCDFKNN